MAALDPRVGDLAFELCKIASVTGHEAAIARHLGQWLGARGFTVHLQELPASSNVQPQTPRFNLIALPPNAPAQPRVFFNSHIDTVPV